MGKKVTLGGDRLGSGNKQKVELKNYERSTHDKGYVWRSTMSAGTLVPFMVEVATPGATFDINLGCEILTQPTIGPLFGSYKLQLDVFACPVRLYHAWLHNNRLNIGLHMDTVKLPKLTLNAKEIEVPGDIQDLNNSQINPSCILPYLGIRGIGIVTDGDKDRDFNAIPLLAVWDIYKNYYANKQEELGAVIHTEIITLIDTIDNIQLASGGGSPETIAVSPATEDMILDSALINLFIVNFTGTRPLATQILINIVGIGEVPLNTITTIYSQSGLSTTYGYNNSLGTITILNWRYINADDIVTQPPKVVLFALDQIDKMRDKILQHDGATAFSVNTADLFPYKYLFTGDTVASIKSSQEGLPIKTYQSDLFNNWLNTEWIDGTGGINDITAVDTTGDKFEINALILARKVYDFLNQIAVSGGTYNDYIEAAYDHTPYTRAETPMYMGGLIKELIFQEVVSNAATVTQDGQQALGTLAGRGKLSGKHKGGSVTVKADEHCYILGLISLTPRVDYSQGNEWHTTGIMTMGDFHVPGMDGIGFQESINEQRAWWTTKWDGSKWVQTSAGKIPAWTNYMTNVNKTYGNFAIEENEMFMTLNRKFEPEPDGDIKDLTTYIDPSKFNNIFAETKIDAQNFWAQIAVDITARQKMSAKLMPNL